MLVEIFPRLAVRLRSVFQGAEIKLVRNATALRITFANSPEWEVDVTGIVDDAGTLLVESCLSLKYQALQNIPREDFLRFVAGENLGLRGATLRADPEDPSRTIRVCSAFMAQKGRTRDEAENLAIDVLSLFRFARLLDDRVQRSLSGDDFCFELYYSTYLSKSVGRNRFINYARGVFTSDANYVFQAASEVLKEDFKYEVSTESEGVVSITAPGKPIAISMRLPEDMPMLVCSAILPISGSLPSNAFELVARLNERTIQGHFEVSIDGSVVAFVSWKQLTNDVRSESLGHLVKGLLAAEEKLTTLVKESRKTSKGKLSLVTPAIIDKPGKPDDVSLNDVLSDDDHAEDYRAAA